MKNNRGHSNLDIIASVAVFIIFLAIGSLVFLGIVKLADIRMQSYEKEECKLWIGDYGEGSGRTPAQWQIDQCERYNIEIQ